MTRGRRPKTVRQLQGEVTRRAIGEFIVGAGGVSALSYGAWRGWDAVFGKKRTEGTHVETITPRSENDPEGLVDVRLEALSRAPLFTAELRRFVTDYETDELALVLENGRTPTLNDPQGRSRIDYVRQEVMRGVPETKIPAHIQKELSFFAPGMLGQESKYHNPSVSDEKAVGISQAIAKTFTLYGKTPKDMKFLVDQVDVMRGMFVDYYSMIKESIGPSLEKIRTHYFPEVEGLDSSQERFDQEFLVPCLVNAYQCGVGNMMAVIKDFAQRPPRPKLRSYDVFETMADIAKDGSVDPHYGEDSYNYVKQSAAFAFLLVGSDTKAR